MTEEELKENIITSGNTIIEQDLTSGTGGNISGRLPGKNWFYISPSGIPYSEIKPENLVKMDLTGEIISGVKKPSIEQNMHLKIYQNREDINAVIHTHSFYAQAVAATRNEIPPITDILAINFGGPIEVAEYARLGSIRLAENVSEKLRNKNGVLLANHGVMGIGEDFEEAFRFCNLIEEAAKLYIFSGIVGEPVPLSEEEIKDDIEFMNNHYGQK